MVGSNFFNHVSLILLASMLVHGYVVESEDVTIVHRRLKSSPSVKEMNMKKSDKMDGMGKGMKKDSKKGKMDKKDSGKGGHSKKGKRILLDESETDETSESLDSGLELIKFPIKGMGDGKDSKKMEKPGKGSMKKTGKGSMKKSKTGKGMDMKMGKGKDKKEQMMEKSTNSKKDNGKGKRILSESDTTMDLDLNRMLIDEIEEDTDILLSKMEMSEKSNSKGKGDKNMGKSEKGKDDMGMGKGSKGMDGKGEMGKGSKGKGDMGKKSKGKGAKGKGEKGKGSKGKGEMGKGSKDKGEMGKGSKGKGEMGKGSTR